MLRKVTLLALAFFMAACGFTKKLPEGSPPPIKTGALLDSIESHVFRFNTLMLSGTGNYKNGKEEQSFRFRIRMLKDSVIWVDITDPFIGGIKVARAVLYPDSFTFVNNLKREFFHDDLKALQQRFGLDFGFYELQNLFSSNQVFSLDKNHELFYRPGQYVLANYPIDREDSLKISPQDFFNQSLILPQFFRPASQRRSVPLNGKNYRLDYEDYLSFGRFYFPKKIRVSFTSNSSQSMELIIKDLNVNQRLNIPFSIPDGYARIP